MNQDHDDADPRLHRAARTPPGQAPKPGSEHVTERQAELLGAAAADELSPAEQRELDQLCASDPRLAREVQELHQTSAVLRGQLSTWSETPPSAELRDRVIHQVAADSTSLPAGSPRTEPSHPRATHPAATHTKPTSPETALSETAGPEFSGSETARPEFSERDLAQSEHRRGDAAGQPRPAPRPRRRRTLVLAAACLALGIGATLAVQAAVGPTETDRDPVALEPEGPPGELGAREPVSFTDPGAEVAVDGALVAHTWGTETVLEIDGLPVGDAFTVVLVGQDGEEIESGSFLGSEVPVECRMNGAVLRENVDRLEIRDASGRALTASELPDVE